MSILLTGGLGYIGSHTAVELLNAGEELVIIDNLSNSSKEIEQKIKQITNKSFKLYIGDVQNEKLLSKVFKANKLEAVIHFAGYKAVGESVQQPVKYYENNIGSTITLLNTMKKYNVKNLIFSSSATVYDRTKSMPLKETSPTGAADPYGRTKLFIEELLKDLYRSDNSYNIAHDSGLIGENPNGTPNNLMPYITRVASGKLPCLSIFGNDYDTKDGTCVRDYIHVVDLAKGHLCALKKLRTNCGLQIYNLGTGKGYSVLDIVNAFNEVCGNKVKYKFAPRRDGDLALYYSSVKKAEKELGWKAERNLKNMCQTSYNFEQAQNKN